MIKLKGIEGVDTNETQNMEKLDSKNEIEAVTLYYKSECFYEIGDLESAVKILHSASELAPNNIGILYRYAIRSFETRRFALAKELFEKIVALDSSYREKLKYLLEDLSESQKMTDLMKDQMFSIVPNASTGFVTDEERYLKYALSGNPNDLTLIKMFEEVAVERERFRSDRVGIYDSNYKLN